MVEYVWQRSFNVCPQGNNQSMSASKLLVSRRNLVRRELQCCCLESVNGITPDSFSKTYVPIVQQLFFAPRPLDHSCDIGCTCSATDQATGSTAEPRHKLTAPHLDHGGTPPRARPTISPAAKYTKRPYLPGPVHPSLLVAYLTFAKLTEQPPTSLVEPASPRRLLPAIRPTSRLTACAQRDFRNQPPLARDTEHTSQPRAVPYTIPPR